MILDTSVVFKWYVEKNEVDKIKADLILEKFIAGQEIIRVPELTIYELANALFYCQRLSFDDRKEAIVNFFNLGLEIIPISREDIINCFAIAKKHKITIYDAVYLVLAKRLRDSLITANPKHQQLGHPYRIIKLADYC